jgi:rod shape determining protein RodA
MNNLKLYLKNFDWLIFAAIMLLSIFGLIEIYSIALGQGALNLLNFKKQVFFISFGTILFFVFSLLDSHLWKSYSKYIYLAGIVVLISVLLFGQTIRGTKGWFSIFGLGLQPVEFIKIVLLMFLSSFFSSVTKQIKPFKYLIFSGLTTMVFVVLVLLQPDFGSALILLALWLIIIALAGFNRKYFVIIGIIAIISSALFWAFFFQDYQKERVMTLLNPSANSLEQGYNSAQAVIAVGSGRLIGQGVGFGSQSQLKFLPEAQNDFIFAVVAEELGFLGVALILSFYLVLFFRIMLAVKKINNDFGIFFVLGGAGLIFIQMFINIGMNIGVVPVVGISLPFVSYGGSSILAHFVLLGIIENIIIKSKINY